MCSLRWGLLKTSSRTESLKWAVLRRTWLTEPHSLSTNQRANQVFAVLYSPFTVCCCCCWKADGPIRFSSVTATVAKPRPTSILRGLDDPVRWMCTDMCFLFVNTSIFHHNTIKKKRNTIISHTICERCHFSTLHLSAGLPKARVLFPLRHILTVNANTGPRTWRSLAVKPLNSGVFFSLFHVIYSGLMLPSFFLESSLSPLCLVSCNFRVFPYFFSFLFPPVDCRPALISFTCLIKPAVTRPSAHLFPLPISQLLHIAAPFIPPSCLSSFMWGVCRVAGSPRCPLPLSWYCWGGLFFMWKTTAMILVLH